MSIRKGIFASGLGVGGLPLASGLGEVAPTVPADVLSSAASFAPVLVGLVAVGILVMAMLQNRRMIADEAGAQHNADHRHDKGPSPPFVFLFVPLALAVILPVVLVLFILTSTLISGLTINNLTLTQPLVLSRALTVAGGQLLDGALFAPVAGVAGVMILDPQCASGQASTPHNLTSRSQFQAARDYLRKGEIKVGLGFLFMGLYILAVAVPYWLLGIIRRNGIRGSPLDFAIANNQEGLKVSELFFIGPIGRWVLAQITIPESHPAEEQAIQAQAESFIKGRALRGNDQYQTTSQIKWLQWLRGWLPSFHSSLGRIAKPITAIITIALIEIILNNILSLINTSPTKIAIAPPLNISINAVPNAFLLGLVKNPFILILSITTIYFLVKGNNSGHFFSGHYPKFRVNFL